MTEHGTSSPALPQVQDLGRLAYAPAFERQQSINFAVSRGEQPSTVLLVEHDPVITVSQRKTSAQHLIASPEQLAKAGIEVQPTNRGGDITYHGPGQLVAYPILRLGDYQLNLSRYMRLLEQVVIDTLGDFGIEGVRDDCATGVWVAAADPHRPQQGTCLMSSLAKICAMGIRVRKNTSMHGLALNVTTDLSHFQTIVPCGLAGRPVTSMQDLLGAQCPAMSDVKAKLIHHLHRRLLEAGQRTA